MDSAGGKGKGNGASHVRGKSRRPSRTVYRNAGKEGCSEVGRGGGGHVVKRSSLYQKVNTVYSPLSPSELNAHGDVRKGKKIALLQDANAVAEKLPRGSAIVDDPKGGLSFPGEPKKDAQEGLISTRDGGGGYWGLGGVHERRG